MKLSLSNALIKAQKALKVGKLEKARQIFSIIVRTYPDNAPANFYLGLLVFNKNTLVKSLQFFLRAITSSPSTEQYWKYYIVALAKSGQIAKARTALIRSKKYVIINDSLSALCEEVSLIKDIGVDDRGEEADLKLVDSLEPSLEQIKDVVSDFEKEEFNLSLEGARILLASFPRSAILYCIQGASQSGLKQFDLAMNSFESAIKLNPNYPNAYNSMANAQMEYGDLAAAINNYGKAIDINPDYVTAYVNRGNALRAKGDYTEMINDFNKAKTLDPRNYQVYLNLAIGLQDSGRVEEAIGNYKNAIECQPDSYLSLFRLHSTYYTAMDVDFDSAIECLKKAFSITQSNGPVNFFLGLLLDYKGENRHAEEIFSLIQESETEFHGYLDSWNWIKSFSTEYPKLYWQKDDGFKYAFENATIDGLIMEFGVASGFSIRKLASMTEQEIHGFDSFEGLPESWIQLPKGAFNLGGKPPSAPKHVIFHVGLFSETLSLFLEKHVGAVKFLNIDCDLYSSTKVVFELLESRIMSGTIIFFDEYFGFPGWRNHEFKAFQEAVDRNNWSYEYLAINLFRQQSVIKIL